MLVATTHLARNPEDSSTLLIALLQFRRNPSQRVLVATTHLARNPEDSSQTMARGYQYSVLFRELRAFATAHSAISAPVVITGDLNAQVCVPPPATLSARLRAAPPVAATRVLEARANRETSARPSSAGGLGLLAANAGTDFHVTRQCHQSLAAKNLRCCRTRRPRGRQELARHRRPRRFRW